LKTRKSSLVLIITIIINDRRKLRHAANASSQPLHDNSVALLDVHNKTSAKTNLELL